MTLKQPNLVLTRLHINENLHLSASQTAAMFAMNFYCPQLQKISKTVTSQCVVCTLFKNNYKNVAKQSYNQFPGLCYYFCTYMFIFCKCSTILCKINFKCSTILVS